MTLAAAERKISNTRVKKESIESSGDFLSLLEHVG